MKIRADVGRHQDFPQRAGSKMRNDEGHLRKGQGEPSDGARIAKAQIEAAGKSELAPHTHRQHAAVHEDRDPRIRRGHFHDSAHALIVQRHLVHGGKKTDASEAQLRHCAGRTGGGVRRRRVEHEEADKSRGVTGDRRGHRFLVPGYARNQGRAVDAVSVKLAEPAIGQCFRRAWQFPLQFVADIGRGACPRTRPLGGQGREEQLGEEMAMRIVDARGAHGSVVPRTTRTS